MPSRTASEESVSARRLVLPLALAQFVASYAATNMNVAISASASDLATTVTGVQTAITLFTLTMASLMIPGSKLTDIWGRKRCFVAGLIVYGFGALIAALAHRLGLLIFGYSVLEGVGSALMIPPIYILVTVGFPDMKPRARYFGDRACRAVSPTWAPRWARRWPARSWSPPSCPRENHSPWPSPPWRLSR
jgi:MFS family permease